MKLTDFGLARAADDASLTKTGIIAGTPQYMSPEQARGESVDQRSDLFSLGSVLYAMCTGRAPFRAETSYGVLRRITDETQRSIRDINPEIPDWLEAIVDKLLAKDPAQRFQTAEEVDEVLGQWLAHLQNPATHPQPRTSTVPRASRPGGTDWQYWQSALRPQRRMLEMVTFSAVAILIAAAVVIFVRSGETPHVVEEAPPQTIDAATQLSVSPGLPKINESKKFSGVYHSPAADTTPKVFRSVLQMEVVVKKGKSEARVQYANGTVVSADGLIVTVLHEPNATLGENAAIESASILLLDGTGVAVSLMAYESAYGVAIFRVKGLDLPPLALSKTPLVVDRRVNWHAVFNNGQRRFLYTRPLQVHKVNHQMAESKDLCQIIDPGTSSLNADRSGSALVALDGTLLGIMGYHKHWQVTPKNTPPRQKLAWAVPAEVISKLIEKQKADPNDR